MHGTVLNTLTTAVVWRADVSTVIVWVCPRVVHLWWRSTLAIYSGAEEYTEEVGYVVYTLSSVSVFVAPVEVLLTCRFRKHGAG